MGQLLTIMFDDAFDQKALFAGGIIGAGLSMAEYARIACTSRLGLYWTRRHLALGGKQAICALLMALPPTEECDLFSRLIPSPLPDYVDFDGLPGPPPILWVRRSPGMFFEEIAPTAALYAMGSWLKFLRVYFKVRPLFLEPPQSSSSNPYHAVQPHGSALFRTFDDIVRSAFQSPPPDIASKEDISQLKKKAHS